jgi:hypothetical protein
MSKRARSQRRPTQHAAVPAARGDDRAVTPDREPAARKPLHRRATTWVVGILVAILAGVVTTYGQTLLGSFLSSAAPPDQLGQRAGAPDAIAVTDVHRTGFNDHLLPAGVTDQALADWDRASGDSPTNDWLDRQGVVEVRQADWEVTLEGRRSTPVEVVDMHPVLDGPCTAPISGALIENPAAGSSDKILLRVQVDKPNAVFSTYNYDDGTETPFFTGHKITLPQGEQNVLVLQGWTENAYCRWRVAVDYLADGSRQTMTISAPGGRPFAATAAMEPESYSDVFLSVVGYGCSSDPYRRVSGSEYAQIMADGAQCPP